MIDLLEKIEYKGCFIKIYADPDATAPTESDSDLKLVILSRNYINPTKNLTSFDEVRDYCRENGAHPLRVDLYVHSDSNYVLSNALDPFEEEGRTGKADGFLIVEREYLDALGWKRVTAKRHQELVQKLASFMESYTKWANGWYEGYICEDANGQRIDSVWGFDDREYMLEYNAQPAIDYYLEKQAKEAAAAAYWAGRDVMTIGGHA